MFDRSDQTPLDPRVPFTRARGLAAGLTDIDLRGRRFQRIFTGVYVEARARVDVVMRIRAALVVSPEGSHASHFTAAEIWGLCPPDQPLTHVSVPAEAEGSRRRGVKTHEMASGADVVMRHGVAVSSPVRTFLEMSELVGLVDLVVMGDRAVAQKLTTPEELIRAADRHGAKGARRARRAARLVRKGVDSPMETRLRLLIVLAGLPEPEVNLILRHADGSWQMRFDLCYPELRLVVEYDGRQHAEDDEQWDRDIDRREEMDEEGWRIIVVRSTGIYVCPERTLHRVRNALRQRGVRNLPRRLRPEWREHFPGRGARANSTVR